MASLREKSDLLSGVPKPSWRIDRFELIFYNPRHLRWQYFAEDPFRPSQDKKSLIEESLHRRQIRNLLDTFHSVIAAEISDLGADSPFTFPKPEPLAADKTSITIGTPSFSGWENCWGGYLDYLLATASYEGLPERDTDELNNLIRKQGRPNPQPHNVNRATAVSILSILPILEAWDTWGYLVRARESARLSREQSPEPLSVLELTYLDPRSEIESELSSPPSPSEEVLGYKVHMGGLWLDIATSAQEIKRLPNDDFFSNRYCKKPDGSELAPYRCYANLVDPILRQLAGSTDGQKRRQFTIAYPINARGRLHFLQIALSADSRTLLVDSLWEHWNSLIHTKFWKPEMRTLLQEDLHRIQFAAFQTELRARLRGTFLSRTAGNDIETPHEINADLPEALNMCLHQLVPVQALRTGDTIYGYDRYEWPDTDNMAPQVRIDVGKRWVRNCASGLPTYPPLTVFPNLDLYIPGLSQDSISKLAATHRARQIIEQQKNYMERLIDGLPEEKRRDDEKRQQCGQIAFAFTQGLTNSQKEAINNANAAIPEVILREHVDLEALGFAPPSGYAPYQFLRDPYCFHRYICQARPKDDAVGHLNWIQSLLRPSLSLLLSEYFETGPAKLLTHKREREESIICISLRESVLSAETLYATIESRLQVLVKRVQDRSQPKSRVSNSKLQLDLQLDTLNAIRVFHDLLRTVANFPTEGNRSELKELRNKFGVYDFAYEFFKLDKTIGRVNGEEDRFLRLSGICPGCLLRDFIEEYKNDIGRQNQGHRGEYHQEHELHTDVLYASDYHKKDQYPVLLAERRMFLPYEIGNLRAWTSKSPVCNEWIVTGAEIGDLCYVAWSENRPRAWKLSVDTNKVPSDVSGRMFVPLPDTTPLLTRRAAVQDRHSYLVVIVRHWWMYESAEQISAAETVGT